MRRNATDRPESWFFEQVQACGLEQIGGFAPFSDQNYLQNGQDNCAQNT